MTATKYWKYHYEDNLVLRVQTADKRILSQGKRLSNNVSKLTKEIQQIYVEGSKISAIKFIMKKKSLSLSDSLEVFKEIAGKSGEWTEPID